MSQDTQRSQSQKALGQAALPLQWQAFSIRSQAAEEDFVLLGYSGTTCPSMDGYVASVLNSINLSKINSI